MQALKVQRVLIVDDQPLFRDGLKYQLQQARGFDVCGEAGSVYDALSLLREHGPDVIILDLNFADGHGLDFIRQAKSIHPQVRLLVISMQDEMIYAERVLRAGATGYISKQEDGEVILSALRLIMRGQIYASALVAQRMMEGKSNQIDGSHSRTDQLTDRELEIFELLGQGLGSREIANRLHLSGSTIDTYRERIKKKLGLISSSELIRNAVEWSISQDHLTTSASQVSTLEAL